jgi:hypothetical protein
MTTLNEIKNIEDYDVIIPNRVNQLDVSKLKVYTNYKPSEVQTLEDFTTLLTEKLGIKQEDWLPIVGPIQAKVFWLEKKKTYSEKKENVHIMNYEDDCVKLQLYSIDSNTIELGWIELNERCKGKGTEIVNCILDTADDLGVDVRVLPVDFSCGGVEPIKYLRWLRDWYKSFEFKSYSQYSPALKYYHSKNN